MIELLKTKIEQFESKSDKYNCLREELQLLILDILDKNNHFNNIAFLGGTALRILYKIRRFSEDLDFSLVNKEKYDFDIILENLGRGFSRRNLRYSFKVRKQVSAVKSVLIKFTGLLYELKLSPLRDENIIIKLDIDENPPLGFVTEFTTLRKNAMIGINHFDQPSMFAGKLHAILKREYTKGRDYFDLLWFISSDIKPNIKFLENALEQSTGQKISLDIKLIKAMLQEKILTTNFDEVIEDLGPFIMDEWGLKHYNQEVFAGVVERQL